MVKIYLEIGSILDNFETSHNVLSVKCAKNVWLVPNKSPYGGENECGIFNHDLTPHLQSRIYRYKHSCQDITYSNNFSSLTSDFLDAHKEVKECIFLGSLPDHYGHFITEGLSRLWYLLEAGVKGPIFYCAPQNFKYHKFIRAVFGHQVKCITEPIRVDMCWVPEPSIILQNYVNTKYWNTVEYITHSCEKQYQERQRFTKVYLSKLDVKNGRNIGEKLLVRYLKSKKIKIMDPAQYELGEFIVKLRSSSEIFASSGTQAHNAIFLKPAQKLVELARSEHVHPFQEYIDQNRGSKRVRLQGYVAKSSGDFSAGPFALYPTEDVRRHFADQITPYQEIWLRSHFKIASRLSLLRSLLYKIWHRYKTS